MEEFTVEQMQEISDILKNDVWEENNQQVIIKAAEVIDNCIKIHYKSEVVLKPCPFCNGNGVLIPEILRGGELGNKCEIRISWYVICQNCGCTKNGGISKYVVNENGDLEIISPYGIGEDNKPMIVDAREIAIEKWNQRNCNCENGEGENKNGSEN